MLKQVMEHLIIYEAARKANLPWNAFQYGKEQEILKICQTLCNYGLEGVVETMSESVLKYLFYDPEFCEKLSVLLKREVSLHAVSQMIEIAGEEKLSQYKYNDVESVLLDPDVLSNAAFPYLKYYYGYGLTSKQKENLMDGLVFWEQNVMIKLNELVEEERKLLWEPIFSSVLLKYVIKEKEDLNKLQFPGVLSLLNYLQEHLGNRYCLEKQQFEQMIEQSKEMEEGLFHIQELLDPEDVPTFLKMWLENGELYYDLNKLKTIYPKLTTEERHQVIQSRAAYIGALYGNNLAEIPLETLTTTKEKLVIYAITHKKKRFLSLLREHFQDFQHLPGKSILLDEDVYRNYLNLNTLGVKELEECYSLLIMKEEKKALLINETYVFSEIAILADLPPTYISLYHQLQYTRSDDRMRVFREVVKQKCLPEEMNEKDLEQLGRLLSEKSLSQWMQNEFKYIKMLCFPTAIKILIHWEHLERFVPDLKLEVQVIFLLRNLDALERFSDFREIQKQILNTDKAWQQLREQFQFDDTFIEENEEHIRGFLYEGGAEIMLTFFKQQPEKREEIRRLLVAELMGRFLELKYFEDDLKKEIAFPVTKDAEQYWKKNERIIEHGIELWEEDRLIPVMQIGEIPQHTCLSYRDGAYNECLLSCFDSNKKVLLASQNGKVIFRAMVRLTKGSLTKAKTEMNSAVEFVDLLKKQENSVGNAQSEELTLFVEHAYFKWLPKEEENQIVALCVRLLEKKARGMRARLVFSHDYHGSGLQKRNFVRSQYYLYISASKNGSQYLDSLGGKATISSSGSYGKNSFWVQEAESGKHKVA